MKEESKKSSENQNNYSTREISYFPDRKIVWGAEIKGMNGRIVSHKREPSKKVDVYVTLQENPFMVREDERKITISVIDNNGRSDVEITGKQYYEIFEKRPPSTDLKMNLDVLEIKEDDPVEFYEKLLRLPGSYKNNDK